MGYEESLGSQYIWNVLKVFLYLGAVLFLLYILRNTLNRWRIPEAMKGGDKGPLRVKQRIPLGVKKQLIIAEYRDSTLLLGVTEHQINLLQSFPRTPGMDYSQSPDDGEDGMHD